MKRTVRLTQTARRDLLRLEDFLAEKSPEAANRAMNALSGALLSLGEHAERGRPAQEPGLRQINVPFGNSGYVIRYRIGPSAVVVTRVKHARER
ncbi:type II toxin-antitoxin system RelE/ParE family toxin [Caulobacter flavus]|uniref:Type II toxin-antitoxin system RelE/ParE family toxin n=1 Tax=Caulobacter flavus TaxID=1679497 RepID=A0A2N5CPF6_9CAUL|nr:type II toxin-antitoxin system RelE/ParE family toxin [Caulobacter flavus]AYV48470.1 type II toxin-antitoxin system RelE/ParE family toxin [Caulobacter flavus]PLR08814.1 type II toxin-antitoxin system RelE/ParE family toxin [Caulobacter flavus]